MLKDRKVFQPIDIRLLNKDKLSMLPRSLSEPLKAEPENSSCQFMLVQRLWTKLLLTTLSGKFGFDTKNRFWSKNQRLSQKLGFIRCRKDCQRSCSSNGSKSNYFIPCRMWFHTFKRFHPWSCQRNRFKIVFAFRTLQIDSKLHKPMTVLNQGLPLSGQVKVFIDERCEVAFEMQAVEPKINIAHSIDGELFSDKK